jgi:hypothetical protein
MILDNPKRLIFVAVSMMLFGCIVPFLMTIKVLESTLFLNFLAFGLSTLGLFLGIAGVSVLKVKQGKRREDEDLYR